MEIKFLKLIKTIVEEGSIASSSEKLFLTQSALSHQLKDLECQLGFRVFYRTRGKWELTDEGIVLYKTSCDVINNINNGLGAIQKMRAGVAGKIKVSTECYSFYQGLPLFIQKMRVFYPDIEVDLVLEATHQPILKVLTHEIDIAIVTSGPSDHPELESIEIFEDEIFAIVHDESPLSKRGWLTARDFTDLHLIIHSFPLKTVSVYDQFLEPNGVRPMKISAVPLTEVALEMVKANMGVICMPKWTLRSFKLSSQLHFKRIGDDGVKRKHYLVVRKSDIKKKYINDFFVNFKDYFHDFG